MISTYEKVISLVLKGITEINQQLLPEQRIDASPETILMGREAKLDSMGLLSLLIVVEGEIASDFGIEFTLVDDNSVLDENILKNVGSLANYITEMVNKERPD